MRWGCIALILWWIPSGQARAETESFELTAEGRWEQVGQPATLPVHEPLLDQARQLIEQDQPKAAIKTLIPWLKSSAGSPVRDRGIWLMAEALYQYGNRLRAFYYLEELLDFYPESPYFDRALSRQYDIAHAFLRGYKRRFLLMPMFGAEEEAIEMLFRIQQRAPGSPLAEKALLRTADHYFASSDFDFAADAYAAYLRLYPRSEVAPKVKLRQAFSALAQFRALRFDVTPLLDAREQLRRVAQEHPVEAAAENVPAVLERIDRTIARKLIDTADYYRRTHQPRAAAYHYRYLIRHYPNLPEAQLAQRELAQLGEAAQADLAVGAEPPLPLPQRSPLDPLDLSSSELE